MNVVVNKDFVIKSGNDIIQYAESFDSYIKRFVSIIESINTVWEGNDSLKYINTMKEKYVVGLEELNQFIKDYGQYLKNIPNAYEILDEVFSSKNIDV